MHFVYLDDSKSERRACFSAICFPADRWGDALDHMVGLRRQMKQSDGIYVSKEIHATEWLGGRGKIAPNFIPKAARVRLYNFYLTGITLIPGVQIFNGTCHIKEEERLFEYMLNRINRNMQVCGSQALIFSDEGKDYNFMLRKLRRVNFVPSQYGGFRNLPLTKMVEDIVYKDSADSHFIQAADCCAYSLLRYLYPTERTIMNGVSKSFMLLERALVTQANRRHNLGIVYE